MIIDSDKLIDAAIYTSYFELFHYYDYKFNTQDTRNKLKYDLTKRILNKNIYSKDFWVKCDETNNPPDIIVQGIIMITITITNRFNIFVRKVINLPIGNIDIDMDKYVVYLRLLKLNKIINK